VGANAELNGLASVAGGGKFANGAVTGAFQYMLTLQGSFGDDSEEIYGEDAGWKFARAGSPADVDKINAALRTLAQNSPTARNLLNELDTLDYPFTIKIEISDVNNYDAKWKILKFNPDKLFQGDGSEKWMFRPPEVGLAHELIHVYHDATNSFERGMAEELATIGLGGNSKYTENAIRNDYKLPLRPHY